MLVRRGEEVSTLVPCGRRRRTEQQLVEQIAVAVRNRKRDGPGVSHHDQLADAA
jgi:hypothetical protein